AAVRRGAVVMDKASAIKSNRFMGEPYGKVQRWTIIFIAIGSLRSLSFRRCSGELFESIRMSHQTYLLMLAMLALLDLPSSAALGASLSSIDRLDRTNLLTFRVVSGAILPVKSVADWQKRRAAILQAMQKVMGPLPGKEKRCPLEMRIDEEVDCGSYVRRLI